MALIRSSTDGRWGHVHFVATGNAATKRESTYACFQSLLSLLLDLYIEVELMNHLVVLFLIF